LNDTGGGESASPRGSDEGAMNSSIGILDMPATDGETDSNHPFAKFVHSKVSAIPSLIGRIIFLASCRKPDTGEYNDSALEARAIGSPCGGAKIDQALRHEHLLVFEDWLCLLFRKWLAEKDYLRFIPTGVSPIQHKLFVADLEAVLAVLLMRTV
jgi:hypothetical protein